MSLPLPLEFPPMEAKLVAELPAGAAWRYEPKWDGFRGLAFRDGDAVFLRSKSGQPLERYFPELVASLRAVAARSFALDGEIVAPDGDRLSFDDLLARIHPAASRVARLARERPALYVAFDLLVDGGGQSCVARTLGERRAALEAFFAREVPPEARIALSPQADDLAQARRWMRALGGGLDGVIAKRADAAYRAGERDAMQKVKRLRSADCVVGGFRYASSGRGVGSLLLGLYAADGALDHVGFTSSVPDREALASVLEPLVEPPGFDGRAPGGPSRWSRARSAQWQPLAPKLVVEVQYDHWSAGRFRHGTRFLRWRPDKAPRQCTLSQVEQESAAALGLLQAAPGTRPSVPR